MELKISRGSVLRMASLPKTRFVPFGPQLNTKKRLGGVWDGVGTMKKPFWVLTPARGWLYLKFY
jgi:hypothetical protein